MTSLVVITKQSRITARCLLVCRHARLPSRESQNKLVETAGSRCVGRGNRQAGNRRCIKRMAQGVAEMTLSDFYRGLRLAKPLGWLAVLIVVLLAGAVLKAQDETTAVDDMTAKYHFLSTDDTLAVLDEEGRLKGYIEVSQPEEESDDVLSYDILDGSRKKSHVEFRTNKIHGKSYRFSGNVERGKGHEEKDPDYLRLIGDLDIINVNGDTGKETVQTVRVLLKSFGKSERPED